MGSTGKEAAATAAAATAQPQMKLLVDKRSRRVLYAEARKDAVDFLIGLLRVPAGLAARVIANNSKHAAGAAPVAPPGSLGTLYAGARALEDAFFVAAAPDRDAILCPSLPSAALPLLLAADPSAPAPAPAPAPPPPAPAKRYFRCAGPYGTNCRGNPTSVTDVAGLPCPVCRQPMTVEMRWSPGDAHGKLAQAAAQEAATAASEGGGGYVKGVVSYLVMDDLTVAPMSTISAIMLLKKFKVADCSALEELTVDLGPREAVLLLKAALESTTALTDVFCGGVSIDRID
ncbi:uncharacterized protein LOC100846444 [Brachypodium distachyon]|uniref:DUF674 domain-containing protein n=1 Tax=Brachypodium distachyon TaxID=15368 RepID=I1ISF5_BRADI|nr:uncharacterized protein LOC100846444 [Brachypodium distachyon]PNT65051.1 hypothetical protein BRADI_4g36900v3 [Brachypodium distachyon]|eukprot:XP_003576791.2 uncharacterized protein LOC100846444 [Brachypodium distachyon]